MRTLSNLGRKISSCLWRVVFRISGNVATTQLLDGHVFHVEADIVARPGLRQRLVMHLDRLYLSAEASRGERYHHTWLDDASLDATYRHCSDACVKKCEKQE